MDERFVGVRVEQVKSKEDILKRVNHNTRRTYQKSVKNDKGIVVLNGENFENISSTHSNYSNDIYDDFNFGTYEREVQKHKSKNKNFHSKRTRTFNEGILYFSEGINEDYYNNPKEFQKRIKTFLKDLEEQFNTTVFNCQIHLDEVEYKENGEEIGNIHLQFMFLNYDSDNGKSLNFTNDKEQGGKLQDLGFKHFETFGKGYKRGIKKETPRRYLTTLEYKEYQESLKINERLKREIKETKQELEEVKKEKETLLIDLEEIKKQKQEYYSQLVKVYKDLKELNELNEAAGNDYLLKVLKWYERSFTNKSKEEKTFKTIQKKIYDTLMKEKKKQEKEEQTIKERQELKETNQPTQNLSNYNTLR